MIIAKILVFIVNFVLWASGILLIVFGSIALASPSTIVNLLDLMNGVSNVTMLINVGSLLEGMAIFMIVLGCFLFLFGGVGCHGIHRMHKRMIMSYWLMLILGILTEIGVIIYGAVYPSTAQDSIQAQMLQSLNTEFYPVTIETDPAGTIDYNTTDSVSGAWEYLQSQTQCCGANGPNDYNNIPWTVGTQYPSSAVLPPTCCQSNIPKGQTVINSQQFSNLTACMHNSSTTGQLYYYTQPCYKIAMDMLWNFEYIAMIIAGCLIATQILGTIITVHTWRKICRDDGRL